MIAVTLSPRLTAVIDAAVARSSGDATDAADLRDIWRRVSIDTERRADAIRSRARRSPCSCVDGDFNGDGRCARCYGRRTT